MKIAVIGAGIVGVTTAFELVRDGYEVTVFERRSMAAEEASFANAGVVAPGYITPWSAPGMPGKVLRSFFSAHAPMRLSLPLSSTELAWMWRWWRACTTATYLKNRQRQQRLALYSRARLGKLASELALDYERSDGYMVLLRSEKERAQAQPGLGLLRELGVSFQELDADAARLIEPALNPDTHCAGAIHLPNDEVGNCRQFALMLKKEAERLGAQFRFSTTVTHIGGDSVATVWTDGDSKKIPHSFDALVLCAGVQSATLLKPLGLSIPLAAVYGYSISAPIREPLNAPRSGVMDERYKVSISRLGQRVRVAGSAELGGTAAARNASAVQTLYKVLQDWFPGAAQWQDSRASVQTWKGTRAMLPDGPPILGASGLPGLWLNLGHGSSGWALSCGSARAVADLIANRQPEIDLEGLDISRL